MKTTFVVKTRFVALLTIKQPVNVLKIHEVIPKLSAQKSNVTIKKIAAEAGLASISNVSIHVPFPTFVDKTLIVRLRIMLESVHAHLAQLEIHSSAVDQYNTAVAINSVLAEVVVTAASVQPSAPKVEIVSLISCV